MKDWIIYTLIFLVIINLLISGYDLFFNKPEQIEEETIRKIQQEVLAEQLKKIPRDTTTIITNTIIREKTKYQLNEFEIADSLKKDSLFWHYYKLWKAE